MKLWFVAMLLCYVSPALQAQEEGVDTGSSIYIPLKPPFVVNYGGVGRLKYLKAEISVRVQDNDAASAVRHHMPYIRNNLVLLFSRQTDETLDTQVGKETLRQTALEEVRTVLKMENDNTGVVDLYFENFILQK
jgi:flagellar FliL protein